MPPAISMYLRPMSETLAAWERAIGERIAGAGDGADPLEVLAEIEPTEAARFALRFMLVDEMKRLTASDTTLVARKSRAHEVIHRGLRGLSLEELTAALVSGALWVSWAVPWEHARFTFLSEHPALATPESHLHVVRAAVLAHGWAGVPMWFVHRLVEDPAPGSGDELLAAWREHRGDARYEPTLAEAVIATGHREGIQEIAATLGSDEASRDAVTATICLDPSTATERLGHLLDPALFEGGTRPLAATHLLGALKANGLRAGEIPGFPSRRPRGWVAADPRWVPLLLALRSHRDPNVSGPVRGALSHADEDVLAASLPPPKKKKTGKALSLRAVGSVPFAAEAYWGDPFATAKGRVALFATPSRLEIRRIDDALPLVRAFDLPAGLALPTEDRDPYDDGWGREGVHGVALHPTASRVAISASADDASANGVLLLDDTGKIIAQWNPDDVLPHRLHWGANAETLWVMADAEGAIVVALDPETLVERGRCAIGDFPPPAYPTAFAHPTDDVACFQVMCGQDGVWVKCVERAKKGYKVRSQKLSAVHHDWVVYGLAEEGAAVLTANDTKLLVRDWPTMKPRKGKVLAGAPHAVVGSGTTVLAAVATVGDAADQFEVFRLPDGDKSGTGPYPDGHTLFHLDDDVVLTLKDQALHAWRLEGLAKR